MEQSEILQKRHYNRLAQRYEQHYDDKGSSAYKELFVYPRMFKNFSLEKKTILEAMCGSGQATAFLKKRGARVIGLDISENLIASFKQKFPTEKSICASILTTGLEDNSVDGVVVIGGLHHLHPHVSDAVREIHRILKPKGFFCFFEPHAGSLPDAIRKKWYKYDRHMFESNESSIDVESLKQEFSALFKYDVEVYGGNLAYLFVFNSLVFRAPLLLKRIYTWPLFLVEWCAQPFIRKSIAMYVVGRWRKIEE